MNIYLVGGAVRDRLLGLPVQESDWVVVGATPEEMRARGYRQVGKDFPVFLHPETGEEYALARTERKTAPGYHGFEFDSAPHVSLEDDLRRRDLTINAMAETPDGELIDPYAGRRDLEARVLRHISPAFQEDPVRVLRVARFAARFAPFGFRVAPETLELMRTMAANGEIDALVPERVWQDTLKALATEAPSVFFQVLRDCDALQHIFPEVERLFGVPQPQKYHPEIDSGIHTLMAVDQAARLSGDLAVRFAALVHDLGKAETPAAILPSHRGHEERGVPLVETLSERLRVPRDYRDLAVLVARYHLHSHRALELKPATLLKLFEAADAFRRPARFEQFLLAAEADARGRAGLEDRSYPQAAYLRHVLAAAAEVNIRAIDTTGLRGAEIGKRLRAARLKAINRHVDADGDGAPGVR
jgi:tRNA nucleotidyltransferase (CCA-adding enzyme)